MEMIRLLSYSAQLQIRARAELELRNRGGRTSPFAHYQFEPMAYIQQKLRWQPWAGDTDHPGQADIIQAYRLALKNLRPHREFAHQTAALAHPLPDWK